MSERVNAFFFGVLVWCAAIAFILLGSRSARAYLDAQHAKREAQRPPRTQPSPKRVSPSGTVLDDVEELDARHSEPVATPDIEIPDWETAKPHLRMQLWHALRHLGAKAGLVTWIDIPRLWSALVYDAPELVIAVNPEQLAKWGVSRDEARQVAIANMIAMPIHETEKTMGSVSVRFLQAPYFAEGQALCLHARDLVGPAGTVFALPSQSVMIAHPVMGMDSLAAPPLMRELCGVIMREQPNPVSPEVYWYNDGKFAVFEMKEVDGQRGIELLADFAEAIDSLDRRRAPSELS